MSDKLEILLENYTDIMEKMAFMFVEEADDDEIPEDVENTIKVHMSFSGEKTGNIALFVPREIATELAANVLGVELDDPNIEQMGLDSIKESLNVTLGNLLTAFYGEEPVFDLSVPAVDDVDSGEWQKEIKDDNTLKILIDDTPAMIKFTDQ